MGTGMQAGPSPTGVAAIGHGGIKRSGDSSDAFMGTYNIQFQSLSTAEVVIFKAFVKSFSDAYTCNWESVEAQGRMDPIQSYSGTGRKISIEWDVVAASQNEAILNLQSCEKLIQMMYPSYGSGGKSGNDGISGPPYFKFKFMNLAAKNGGDGDLGDGSGDGLFGTTAGVTYAPDLEQGVFGIGKKIFPKVVSLSIEFTVLHESPAGGVSPFAGAFPYGASTAVAFAAATAGAAKAKQKANTKARDASSDVAASSAVTGIDPETTAAMNEAARKRDEAERAKSNATPGSGGGAGAKNAQNKQKKVLNKP